MSTKSNVPLPLRLAGVAVFLLAGLLAFSPWLVRNQLWAGNPVFPEAASVLGQGHFSDAQVERWKQAHSPRPDQRGLGGRLTAWAKDVWGSWQYGYLLLPLGLAAGVVGCLRRVPQDHADFPALKNAKRLALLLLGMFGGLSVIWLGFTHLQGRFFILGVPIAGLLLAVGIPALAPRRSSTAIVAALLLVAAGLAFVRLHGAFREKLSDPNWILMVGLEQFDKTFVPREYDEAIDGQAPLALIGDAKVFAYVLPMSRITYRTVFDVDAKPGESALEAWSAGAPPGAWRLVHPDELRRFSKTYRDIPPLPPPYQDATEPFGIPPAP